MLISYVASLVFIMMTIISLLYTQKLSERIVLVSIYLTGIIFVWYPEASTKIANLFGMVRGLDFVFLVACIAGLNIAVLILRALKSHNRKLTILAREIAKLKARQPGE